MSRSSRSASVRGARASRRAATSSGVGAGLGLEALDLDRLLPVRSLLLVEVVPAAVAGRGDAARLEREVVGVRGLRQRFLERDQMLAAERDRKSTRLNSSH